MVVGRVSPFRQFAQCVCGTAARKFGQLAPSNRASAAQRQQLGRGGRCCREQGRALAVGKSFQDDGVAK
eukprot:1432146-Lingulodinium_polyedra.AAC.1